MTQAGRNDPCPCGSGRKYKKCCFERERDAPTPIFLPQKVKEAAAAVRVWQADLVPLPVAFDDDPSARPAALLVTAGELVVGNEILSRPSAEWEDVAQRLDLAVAVAGESVGASPRTVEVRHPEIAAALEPLLGSRDIVVRCAPLPELDEVARSMIVTLTGQGPGPLASMPVTWAGWGLPAAAVAEIFGAAAALWRAAPWHRIANEQALDVEFSDDRDWTASVLGQSGQEFGLVLYSEPDDFFDLLSDPSLSGAFADPFGRVLSLSFDRLSDLPRPMQREVASAGWEVAAPEAYPVVFAINTPAGGITRQDAADLAAAARALAALPEDEGERIGRGELVEWADPGTGVLIGYDPDPDLLIWDDGPYGGFEPRPALWSPPTTLRPGGAEGPGARPEAVLDPDFPGRWPIDDEDEDEAAEVLEGFEAALVEQGFSASTVDRHVTNVDAFLEVLLEWTRIPLAAVHEYDLRLFLFDLYPRKFDHAFHRQKAMPVSLGRFFGWLAEEEGIQCPWADEVLGEREAYEILLDEYPGGAWWDEDVQAWREELFSNLHDRALLHDDGLGKRLTWGEGGPFGRIMGVTEATLDRALQRRWLLWRDEVIRGGEATPSRVRTLLVQRQREWERTPNPDLDGDSPLEAIEKERARRGGGG